jgi:hypothetical protein
MVKISAHAAAILPAHGRGKLIFTAACPRTGRARTGTETPHEPRGLKHRPDSAIRVIPSRPCWSVCSAATSTSTATHRTGGCSTAQPRACLLALAATETDTA